MATIDINVSVMSKLFSFSLVTALLVRTTVHIGDMVAQSDKVLASQESEVEVHFASGGRC